MTLWPCHECGADGVRNLGTQGYCSRHLAAVYNRFDPTVFQLNGVGLQEGPPHDHWAGHYELACCACRATWVGVPGEPCRWCAAAYERMLGWQVETTLTPPDIDPDNQRWVPAILAWADRVQTAVSAELISQAVAERALTRATTRTQAV